MRNENMSNTATILQGQEILALQDEQTAGVQFLLIVALVAQKLIQGLPVVGGIAQTEPDEEYN